MLDAKKKKYFLQTTEILWTSTIKVQLIEHHICILHDQASMRFFDLERKRYYMSRAVRKPAYCICENKGADQLRGNRKADQCLCFRYTDSTIPLLSKYEIFKPLAIFCSCTAWFVSDQIGNQNVGFLMTRLMIKHL